MYKLTVKPFVKNYNFSEDFKIAVEVISKSPIYVETEEELKKMLKTFPEDYVEIEQVEELPEGVEKGKLNIEHRLHILDKKRIAKDEKEYQSELVFKLLKIIENLIKNK